MMQNMIEKLKCFFWIPKKYNSIFTHLTIKEKLQLLQLSKSLPKKSNLVEIGSYLGASSCVIALGIQNKQSKLYCVDTFQNDAMTEGPKNTFEQFQNNTMAFHEFVLPLKGLSKDVSKSFSEPIDFIFFDGDHSYEGIKTDWDHWSPHLKKGAIVVFHDSGWAEGVKKVLQEDVAPQVIDAGSLPNMYWAKIK